MSEMGYSQPRLAEFYDAFGLYRDRADVPFFVEEAVRCGSPVLELGCGTGRVLIPVARAGVEIVGLDASSAMLDRGRENAAREDIEVQRRITWVPGDMRSFVLGRQFKLITLPFRPFQHLMEVADQLACLRSIHKHLMPDGRVIVDVFNPSFTIMTDPARANERTDGEPFDLPDGRHVVRHVRIAVRDHVRQFIQVEVIYYMTHPNGQEERIVETLTMRYFFRFEMEHLLARAGFEIEHILGNYRRDPFGTDDPGELIVIAKKLSSGKDTPTEAVDVAPQRA